MTEKNRRFRCYLIDENNGEERDIIITTNKRWLTAHTIPTVRDTLTAVEELFGVGLEIDILVDVEEVELNG